MSSPRQRAESWRHGINEAGGQSRLSNTADDLSDLSAMGDPKRTTSTSTSADSKDDAVGIKRLNSTSSSAFLVSKEGTSAEETLLPPTHLGDLLSAIKPYLDEASGAEAAAFAPDEAPMRPISPVAAPAPALPMASPGVEHEVSAIAELPATPARRSSGVPGITQAPLSSSSAPPRPDQDGLDSPIDAETSRTLSSIASGVEPAELPADAISRNPSGAGIERPVRPTQEYRRSQSFMSNITEESVNQHHLTQEMRLGMQVQAAFRNANLSKQPPNVSSSGDVSSVQTSISRAASSDTSSVARKSPSSPHSPHSVSPLPGSDPSARGRPAVVPAATPMAHANGFSTPPITEHPMFRHRDGNDIVWSPDSVGVNRLPVAAGARASFHNFTPPTYLPPQSTAHLVDGNVHSSSGHKSGIITTIQAAEPMADTGHADETDPAIRSRRKRRTICGILHTSKPNPDEEGRRAGRARQTFPLDFEGSVTQPSYQAHAYSLGLLPPHQVAERSSGNRVGPSEEAWLPALDTQSKQSFFGRRVHQAPIGWMASQDLLSACANPYANRVALTRLG
ncbi:MAG: hypothetical protein M1826_000305 [Phylliscum demangeonii]|nr:MAG: hypothetical protein M1826_000305 [Phylliscum demangeonii]